MAFDPSTIRSFELANDYRTTTINIRTETKWNTRYVFLKGEKLKFGYGFSYDHGGYVATYQGQVVTQLDLNNGKSLDDIDFRQKHWFSTSRDTISYRGSWKRGKEKIVTKLGKRDAEFATKTFDTDGIDGGAPAELNFAVIDDAIVLTLLPMTIADATKLKISSSLLHGEM